MEKWHLCSILLITLKSTKKKRSFEASSSGGSTVVGGGWTRDPSKLLEVVRGVRILQGHYCSIQSLNSRSSKKERSPEASSSSGSKVVGGGWTTDPSKLLEVVEGTERVLGTLSRGNRGSELRTTSWKGSCWADDEIEGGVFKSARFPPKRLEWCWGTFVGPPTTRVFSATKWELGGSTLDDSLWTQNKEWGAGSVEIGPENGVVTDLEEVKSS